MANLRSIVSNDRPIREENYPRTWFLYKDNHLIEIHVKARRPQPSFRARQRCRVR